MEDPDRTQSEIGYVGLQCGMMCCTKTLPTVDIDSKCQVYSKQNTLDMSQGIG